MFCAIWYHLFNFKTWKTPIEEYHFEKSCRPQSLTPFWCLSCSVNYDFCSTMHVYLKRTDNFALNCFFKKISIYLALIYIKWVPEDPSTTFLVTSSTRKMPECSDSMNSSIFMPENIWYHHFTWSGLNSQEILNFVLI